ncbi:rod shape-determining protein MreC [Luteolibacter ambystomatis]|uniref:Cell shape-determining protein MreC n=1 Tax=Luteolibacter ambystomatis TaxID=2824561 RepID=A0A975J1P9_9BACT|nr:rod shape-determining protein MreC [Luteolibacter ambystomatis]QUE52379.1 rod shape-determining protein MreC [Luteolibacter ambystomatis]
MKPQNLIALLLFLGGAVWALTRNEYAVREIQSRYYAAISPFLKSGSTLETKARAMTQETQHSKELEIRLQEAEKKVGRLEIVESRFRELEKENASLREAVKFTANTRFDVVAASIVRRQPTTWWQTVEIDRGEDAKVGAQLPVLSYEGLVGKVDLVRKDRASVVLLTDEKCQVSAKVEGTPEVGILSGQRGQFEGTPLLRLRFLSKDATVRKGQRVFTTGRGGLFPANVLLGTVESVEKGSLDSEALVRPSVNFADLETVFVVLLKGDKQQ